MFCKVCGDQASGKHYGVVSCDGCRGFFKRCVRRNLNYVCKGSGNCVVEVANRNQCQGCRFRKCLQENMRRDAVQPERAPRIRRSGKSSETPVHRRASPMKRSSYFLPAPNAMPNSAAAAAVMLSAHPVPCMPTQPIFLRSPIYNTTENVAWPGNALHLTPVLVTTEGMNTKPRSEVAKTHILDSEPKKDGKSDNTALMTFESPELIGPFFEHANESAARILFLAVKWASKLPTFSQLVARDQRLLLESAWGQLFVLTAAQWSFRIDEETLGIGTSNSRHQQMALEEVRSMRRLINRCSFLQVDHTEFSCLKALALLKPECPGIEDTARIEFLQDQTHLTMADHCVTMQRCETEARRRIGRLMLIMNASRNPTPVALHEVFFRQTVGDIPIERVLAYVLEAVA